MVQNLSSKFAQKNKMFGLERDFKCCSIGHYTYTKQGRPTEKSELIWAQRCNFVFKIVAKILCTNESKCSSWGWIVHARTRHDSEPKVIYIKCDDTTSSANIKRIFMKHITGGVCQITNDDFLQFLQGDSEKGLPSVYMSEFCGRIKCNNASYWAFPNITIDEDYEPSLDIIVNRDSLMHHDSGERYIIPSGVPEPMFCKDTSKCRTTLSVLGSRMLDYYGPRFPHAVHLISSVLKSLHRSTLMNNYNQVSITNISGPANVGKTFGCAIALKMMSCDSLILTKCSSSAMLDACYIFRDLVVCWDDPRDASHIQLSSIVHECFHGHTSSTISKGNRAYNSSLIIGTQEKLLGLPYNEHNIPTFTRMSHIDMTIAEEFRATKEAELALKSHMSRLPMLFRHLLTTRVDTFAIQSYYKRLCTKTKDVVDRALQIAAIDWYFCDVLCKLGFSCPRGVLDHYFLNTQVEFLNKFCSKVTIFERFLEHMRELLKSGVDIPPKMLKSKVDVDIKNYGNKNCLAIHSKTFFDFLYKHVPKSKSYTSDMIHSEIKSSKGKLGDISRNVAYKIDGATCIQRSLVIRHDVLFP